MSKSVLSMVPSRKAITSSALASYSLRRKRSNPVDSCEGRGGNPPIMEENGARILLYCRKILKNGTPQLNQEEEF